MKPVTLLLGGDLAPTPSNYSLFAEGNLKALIDDSLLAILDSVDCRVFNLEVPLTDAIRPISKDGPNLIAPVSSINGIKLLNPTVIGLANNHILDYDELGLIQTMDELTKHEIIYVGAGKDLINAAKPHILEKNGLKIGIYACAENEFSIAKERNAGANPFDPLESLDHIANLKSVCNYVIVLYHGGKEHYRYPSPYLQKVSRKMVEKGADLVVCQHSHCIGAFEEYRESTIVYGQGNFLFDYMDNAYWRSSLLLKITLGDEISVEYIPICKKKNGIELAPDNVKDTLLEAFYVRSEKIKSSDFVEAEFYKFCTSNGLYYLHTFAGFGKILRKLDRLLYGRIIRQIYSAKKLNMLHNYINCEAHRELLLNYLISFRK